MSFEENFSAAPFLQGFPLKYHNLLSKSLSHQGAPCLPLSHQRAPCLPLTSCRLRSSVPRLQPRWPPRALGHHRASQGQSTGTSGVLCAGASPRAPTGRPFSFRCPLHGHRPREALPNHLIQGDARAPITFFSYETLNDLLS